MFRYLLIETKVPIESYETTIISLFSEFIEPLKIDILNKKIAIYYQHDVDVSLKDIIINLTQDTLVDFRLYQSYRFDSLEKLEVNRAFIEQKLAQITFNTFVYIDDHLLLKYFLSDLDQTFKKHILKKYEKDQLMLETVKNYLESNQNMSVAAKKLYIHRNTLIQRLDKFFQTTGFDVKTFNDGFLIYHLLLIK